MKLPDLVLLYTEHRRSLGYSKAWFVHARLSFRDFLTLTEGLDAQQVQPEHLHNYWRWLNEHKSHLVLRTRHRRLSYVLKLFRWATQRSLVVLDPGRFFAMKNPSHQALRFVPTAQEMERLLEAPDPTTLLGERDRFLFELLYGTGLRRRELANLELQDYLREQRTLRIQQGKGRADRFVPLGDRLAALTEHYLDTVRPALQPPAAENALVVGFWSGGKVCGNTLYARLRYYTKRIGLKKLCLHSFRHAYAGHLLEGGATLQEVAHLLGHQQLSSTEIYTRIHPQDLIREYQRTHPRARRRP